MKILCLQLARYGDIFQTWPTLSALRRRFPYSEIHFLVREKFSQATEGLASVDKVRTLKTRDILAPVYENLHHIDGSIKKIEEWIQELREEEYDQILNLSFSPLSSYLVEAVSSARTVVRGYTRHSDGFLSIPDDASRYFYAQAGLERPNRIHLTDLMALVSGVELCASDFLPPAQSDVAILKQPYVVLHVGASETHKTCSSSVWATVAREILKSYSGSIVFIGAESERDRVPDGLSDSRVLNLVGQTRLADVFGILRHSQGLLGGDSMALHMAAITNTPALNVTFPTVKFWETGPRSAGSRVLWYENAKAVDAVEVAEEWLRLIHRKAPSERAIPVVNDFGVIYQFRETLEESFEWNLTKALYMQEEFPVTDSPVIRMGFSRLKELAILALEQIQELQKPERRATAVQMLDQVEALMARVGALAPDLSAVIRWFQAEKINISPGSLEEVMRATAMVFQRLRDIGQIYEIQGALSEPLLKEDSAWKY